jgi:hypothetical protein
MKKAIVRSLLSGVLLAAFLMPESAQAVTVTVKNESDCRISVSGNQSFFFVFSVTTMETTLVSPRHTKYLSSDFLHCPISVTVHVFGEHGCKSQDFKMGLSGLPVCLDTILTITRGKDGIKVSPWPSPWSF